jgi:hypothetical protein
MCFPLPEEGSTVGFRNAEPTLQDDGQSPKKEENFSKLLTIQALAGGGSTLQKSTRINCAYDVYGRVSCILFNSGNDRQ